jgi:predicted secreted protein
MIRSPILVTALMGTAALAQAQVLPQPQNVLQLATSATAEVPQDMLAITLQVQREGSDANAVQSQLRTVLDAALTEARKAVRPGQLDLRAGSFGVYPRYAPKGGVNGWQGRAELVLEGRDMPAISQLAGKLSGMSVAGVSYGLSRETREKVEADVAAQAIGKFKARADVYARQFGFGAYSFREVNVGQADAAFMPQGMPRVRAMSASMGADESVPVEAGKTSVTVTVSGSVQMSPR